MKTPISNPFLTTRAAPDTEQTLYRSFELDRASVDETARTVALSFSSEMPVERYFGSEVLDHSPGSVRLTRLNNGAPLLLNHDCDEQVGVVESATIDAKAKKGRAVVRFSKSEDGEEIFQDVLDGIRRLVSVGYRILKTVTESKPGGVEIVRVTDWEPYEISLVSIPADDSVGVGRGDPSAPAISNFQNQNTAMPNSATPAPAAVIDAPAATRAAEPVVTAPSVTVVREAPPVTGDDLSRAITAERQRTSTIGAIAAQARNQGLTIDEHRAISEGLSADQFRSQVYDALISRQSNYQPGAPSRGETRDLNQFSLARGLQLLATGERLSGIEAELHQEAQREAMTSGIALQGQFCLPTVLINHGRRDMTATGGSNGDQGGSTISTTFGSFIELLYSKMVLRNLGAQFLTGLTGNVSLPKLLTGSVPVKKDETTALAESSPTTGNISLSPKRNGTFIEVTKQLLAQSPLAIESILRNDLATALGLAMELGAINGGGTNEPTGILNTSSIGSVAGGTDGLAPTWANIVALETAVAIANADMGSLGYLTNSKVRGKLKGTAKVSGTDSRMVWDESSTPLNGYRAEVTNQVPANLEKGSSGAVCSAIIFGNFADLVIAQWGGIDISVNPYIKDTEGLVRITAECFYDSAVRRAGSFAAMKDALTA